MMKMGSSVVQTAYSWISFGSRRRFMIWASAKKSFGSIVPNMKKYNLSQFTKKLCDEILKCILARFQSFNRNRRRIIPQSFPNFAELTVAEFSYEFKRFSVDFPLVAKAKTIRLRLINLKRQIRVKFAITESRQRFLLIIERHLPLRKVYAD